MVYIRMWSYTHALTPIYYSLTLGVLESKEALLKQFLFQ